MWKLSLVLLVLLVLVGCGEESEEITEAKTKPVDEFVGKWHTKSINGKPIDDYFKELAIVGFEEELDEGVTHPHRYRNKLGSVLFGGC